MIREERFRISRRPYAVDLDSLRTDTAASGHSWAAIDAVWFRRRSGVTIAVIGQLRDLQDSRPESAREALDRACDGRYGGAWIARWDGEGYASESPQEPEATVAQMAILRPMLERYPGVPPGYDGWWRYPTSAENRAMRGGRP